MAAQDSSWQPWRSLADASRVPTLTRRSAVSAGELAMLVLAGIAAACAEAWVPWNLPSVPGHSIFKSVLPMMVGFAFVPRHGSGKVMGISAGLSAFAITQFMGGEIQPAAGISMMLIGPSLDMALAGTEWTKWIYVRFSLAGVFANLTALGVKVFGSFSGLALIGQPLSSFIPLAIPSYLLCGACAGLFAVFLFRHRSGSSAKS